MKKPLEKFHLLGTCATAVVLLAGCATPPTRDFGGSWLAVNRFGAVPERIPLHRAYVYFASPLDATLKTLLERWARDARLRVEYRVGSDFTLHAPVSGIRTSDVHAAAAQLSGIYAQQGVSVTFSGGAFVVDGTPATTPASTTPASTGATSAASTRGTLRPAGPRRAIFQSAD